MYLIWWTLTYFLAHISLNSASTLYTNHVSNYVSLVSAYRQEGYSVVDVPPLNDLDGVMEVNVSISIYAINGFDEVAGNIELVAAIHLAWGDEITSIRSVFFIGSDKDSFLIPHNLIWTPKLILTNAIGDTSVVGDKAFLCRYNMNTKRVTWSPRVVISGSCTPDVTFYPFDKQSCEFIYTAWGFQSDEILLQATGNEWGQEDYGLSGEWDITETSTETYISNSQSYINFKLTILRKPLYFAFNIILPVLVLCLLNATVFLLPAESGERVGFSVTCFLSFVVLLNMIMDIMPRSSSPISFLCYYVVVMMANSGGMTLVTILLMRVYYKPPKSKVPKWIQRSITFINCGCARLRCCVLCCRAFKRKCSCRKNCHKRKQSSESDEILTQIAVDTNRKSNENREESEKETEKADQIDFDNDGDNTRDTSDSKNYMELAETENYKCFGFRRKGKKGIAKEINYDIESELYASAANKYNNESGIHKRNFENEHLGKNMKHVVDCIDVKKDLTVNDENENIYEFIKQDKNKTDEIVHSDDSRDSNKEEKEDDEIWNPKQTSIPNSIPDPVVKNETQTFHKKSEKEKLNVRQQSVKSNMINTSNRRKSLNIEARRKSIQLDARNQSTNHDTSKPSSKAKLSTDIVYFDIKSNDSADESDVDSLADLEEEVVWAEVGRICDTFFFLAFLAAQGFFTVVFLVPLFVGE